MKRLGAPTPKSTYWEYIPSIDKTKYYLMKHRVWPYPMWTFHLLRKMALFLDKLADIPRKIIWKYEKDLSPKIEIKK